MPDRESLKAAAAERALELVRPGMVVGLGTGSTSDHFLQGLARLVGEGLTVTGVPSSRRVAREAAGLGIPITESIESGIDLAVDGADEIDPHRNLIKGAGGALLREKLVAMAARRYVIIADQSKLSERLGRKPVPVEVLPFLWRQTAARLEALGHSWRLRQGVAGPFQTDNGNLILDLTPPSLIEDPARLAADLKAVAGVLDHGLFVGLADTCLIAGEGGVTVLGALVD